MVRSITRFLTDASLIALCNALGAVTRAKVTIHDHRGRRINYTDGNPPWALAPDDEDARTLEAVINSASPAARIVPADGRLVEPLMVAGTAIGAIVVEADPLRITSTDLDRLRDIVAKLASTVGEFCEQEELLRHRNAELSVLFRLSSLLVTARETGAMLNVALRSAIEILGADAGMVHLINPDGQPRLWAHANLSADFVNFASGPGAEGDALLEWMRKEDLSGIVSGSLFFSGQSIGTMRLFWRRAIFLDPEEQALMQTIVEQVSAAVASARLIESERENRAVQRQLQLAADVQRRMLPRTIPTHPRLDIDARYIPTMQLGGDFYDLIELAGHMGILIGDVAGKGFPAALLMAAVRSSFRAHATDVYHLNDVISRVNKDMARDTLPNEFATIFYGVIDPYSLRLTYCNAGHDPPLLLRPPRPEENRPPEDRDLYELAAGGMVVGVDPAQSYARGMFDLMPGDTIIAYTDGIIDARNFESKRFGRDRLRRAILDVITNNPNATARAVADHIVWEVRRYIGLNPQTDDETLVVLRVMR